MVFDYTLIGLVILFVWLAVISFLLYKNMAHYNRMTNGVNEKSLKSVLESLLTSSNQSKKDIETLYKYYDKLEKDSLLHIQKLGLLRFNPFKDTGGDQSFILSLTDKNNSGVIISALYSRSGTRWYAKRVANGKGVEHVLSAEEEKALKAGEKI